MYTPKQRFDLLQVKNALEKNASQKYPRHIMNLIGHYILKQHPKYIFAQIQAILTKPRQARMGVLNFLTDRSWLSEYPSYFNTDSWKALIAPAAESLTELQYQNHLDQILDTLISFTGPIHPGVDDDESDKLLKSIIREAPLLLEAILIRLRHQAREQQFHGFFNRFILKKIVCTHWIADESYSLLSYALTVNPKSAAILKKAGAILERADLRYISEITQSDSARVFLDHYKESKFLDLLALFTWGYDNGNFIYEKEGYDLLIGINKIVKLAGGYSKAIELLGIADNFDRQAKFILLCAWSEANPDVTKNSLTFGVNTPNRYLTQYALHNPAPTRRAELDSITTRDDEEAALIQRIKNNLPG